MLGQQLLKSLIFTVAFLALGGLTTLLRGQCFQLIDGNGNPSTNPRYIHCAGTAYTLYLQTNVAVGAYTINWGDGNTSSGASLVPPATLSHVYPATPLRNYTITFTETSSSCTRSGLVVLERPVNASITRPMGTGGATTICAPGSLEFINTSTDVSANTTFRWNFGDGSAVVVRDSTNYNQTETHLYQRNTVNCNTVVRLEAENYCTTTPSFAQVGPINIYDLDIAAITPTSAFLCYPDTIVGFLNTSALNCRPQGNTVQRYEYWNFGNYWGKGTDSLKGWTPFANPPSVTQVLAFPGKGTYNIMLVDSNMCGRDTAFTAVTIGDPPTAAFSPNKDTICTGQSIMFANNSAGGNQSVWNFGDGVWRVRSMANQTRTFNAAGTFEIILAVNITGGTVSCTDTVRDTIVVLAGPEALFTINPSSACDSLTVSFTNTSSNANEWNWNFGDATTDTVQHPPPHAYTSFGVYNIQLTVTHPNGCTNAITRTATVYASPVVAFTPNNVCEDAVGVFTDLSTSPGGNLLTTWKWKFGDGDSSSAQHPTHIYTGSGTYQLSLSVATDYCSKTDTFSIVVEPKPTALFALSPDSGCATLPVVFSNNSLLASSYFWDFGDGDTSMQTAPTHNFLNTTGATRRYNIRLIAASAFGCRDTTFDSVAVFHNPAAAFTHNATPQCAPFEVSFTNTSSGALSYLWLFGDGDTSTALHPKHTYQNQTLFIDLRTVRLIAYSANGCTDTAAQNITVYPEPIFTFQSIPDSGCSPLSVSFPSVIGAVGYKWYFGDGDSAFGPSPTHIYTNSSTNNALFNVLLIATSSFGCSDTNTGTVKVFPNPNSDFTLADSAGCQPHVVRFTNNSTGAIGFTWQYGNGDTSNNAFALHNYSYTHTSATPHTYAVSLITHTINGCRDTSVRQTTIFPQIRAGFTPSIKVGCSPLQVGFSNTAQGALLYTYNFGDGSQSNSTAPNHTFNNAGLTDTIFGVEQIVTSAYGCKDSITDSITVHPLPQALFNKNFNAGCHPLPVMFTNNSVLADTSFWDFGDGVSLGSNSSSLIHTYQNTGTVSVLRTIELRVETRFGCRDTARQTVDIYPQIIAGFGFSDTAGCSPLSVSFTHQSTGAQFYTWMFGDGNSAATPNTSHTYSNSLLRDTVFFPKLLVTSTYGCRDSISDTVSVYPLPRASFNTNVLRGCQPLPVDFINNSLLNDFNFWSFGDGDTSMYVGNPVHTYVNTSLLPRNYTAKLEVATLKGCVDSISKIIEVFPLIEADFDATDTLGCSDLRVEFSSVGRGENQYFWIFGDGQTDVIGNPVHIFSNPDTIDAIYTTKLRVTSVYGCTDSLSKNIMVYPQPKALFTATPTSQKFPSATIAVLNSSSAGPWSHTWQYSDTAISGLRQPAPYTYPTWGKFEIRLIVTGAHCADTASQWVEISPPRAVVAFKGAKTGCRPVMVSFENYTQYGESFFWSFGDGGTSTLAQPAPYTYYNQGVFSPRLTVIGYDGDAVVLEKTDSVVVNEIAEAYFDYRPEKVAIPSQAVNFYNLSRDADRYLWDMGDGTTYVTENPEHKYTEGGVYTVRLISDNPSGCADTFEISNAVTAESSGKITFPTAFIPDASGRNGGIYDPNSLENKIFFPVFEGVIEYELMIFNRWGEMVFRSEDVAKGWDGFFRDTDKICPQDVYVWKAEGKYANGSAFREAGEVTLLR
jgi:PKD repeat protein